MTDKTLEATATQGLGVGSGVAVNQPIGDLSGKDDQPLCNNVTDTKDGRRPKGTHPNPTIAQTIATMSLAGFTVRQVCEALKVSPETITDHYDHEMKHGRTNMMTQVVQSLAQRAISGSDTAAIFLAKARLGWSDRQQVELTGKDGGPIEIEHRAAILTGLAGTLEQGITLDHEPQDEKKGGD